jgi:hypothetical protein
VLVQRHRGPGGAEDAWAGGPLVDGQDEDGMGEAAADGGQHPGGGGGVQAGGGFVEDQDLGPGGAGTGGVDLRRRERPGRSADVF